MQDRQRLEQRASVVKAMASAPRLALVEELSSRPRTVGDLAGILELDISTVSRHLSILRNAGIVSSTRQGNSILYSLRAVCILQFFECVEKVLSAEPDSPEGQCCT